MRVTHLFSGLFPRPKRERDLDAEVRSYVEILSDEKLADGLSAESARRAALIEIGGLEQVKEDVRQARPGAWMRDLVSDIRYAVRAFLRSPGFTLIAVLSLALGIGANTTAFISVNALAFHPLPYPGVERIVTVWESLPKLGTGRDPVAPANYLDWSGNTRSFERLAAYSQWDASLTGAGDPERIQAGAVTPGFFEVFGMRPALGRTFLPDEAAPGRDGEVVVSYGFWKSRLGASPDAIGRTVSLGNRAYTVVGVMPEEFDFPLATQLWAPLALTPEQRDDRAHQQLLVLGRLRPDVPLNQARAEMAGVARMLERRSPQTNEGRGVAVTPLLELTNQVTDRFTLVLLGAAFFVLLLACANIANLQLARALARRKEIAMRTALGASRLRIARQLLTETILLGLAGGAVGLLLGSWNLQVVKATVPEQVYHWVAGFQHMRLDAASAAFSLALSLLAGLLCGLPAIYQLLRRKSAGDLNEALKEGGRTGASAPASGRLRGLLVAGEAALALVLLVGAGLMVQTFQRMLTFDTGIDPHNLLTLSVALPETGYRDTARIAAFQSSVLDRFAAIPGVEASGSSANAGTAQALYIEGRGDPRPGEPRPQIRAISSRYFETMKIPLLEGRSISRLDGRESPPVVVLGQSVARYYWPGSNPVGRRIRLQKNGPWLTVAGVCGDLKFWFDRKPFPVAYVPEVQSPRLAMSFFVRTDGAPASFAGAVREPIRAVDSTLPVFDLKTMDQVMAEETSGVRGASVSMASYAVIALLLAAIGIYSISSFFVVQRTHEIGVRMALGANPGGILRLALSQSLKWAWLGLAIGLPLALLMNRAMSSALYGVVDVDWRIFAGLTGLLAFCALLAGFLPAHRASRLDPMSALRDE
jgi:putative ABC transport system permease protein